MTTGGLTSVLPREIAYSQTSVGLTIYNGEEEPGVSVRAWDNIIPYTIPIDVVLNEVGEICSFDNRRLYAARNHAPVQQHLMVREHNFTDFLPEDKVRTSAADIFLWWEKTVPRTGETEVHGIRAVVTYWGLLIAYRSAHQSTGFSLNGSHIEPTVRHRPFQFTPYYQLDRVDCVERPMHDDAIDAMATAITGGSTVCFSRTERGIIMFRPDFNQLLLRHIGGLQVKSYFKYESQSMILRAKGERKHDHWPDDEDLFRAENDQLEDIETLWLKADLAEVPRLQTAITTCLFYVVSTLAPNSLILEDLSREMTLKTGCPVMLRTLVPSNSTVVVLDVYGDVDDNNVAAACGEAVAALCVMDADLTGDLDDEQVIHVRPVWTHVVAGVSPPDEVLIPDTSEDLQTSRLILPSVCVATTRTGNPCRNTTMHASGSCWRHRMGK